MTDVDASSMMGGRPARREWEVLVLCARSRPEPRVDDRLRILLSGPLDWELLMRMAWINRMVPLLHWHALRLGAAMPAWTVTHLDETRARNDERNRRLMDRMVALISALDDAGIPFITFKGPTFEARAYAAPGVRECADIDILVREADLAATVPVIERIGYRLEERLGPLEERIFRGYHFAYEFVDATGAANVDAHWQLLPSTWNIPLDYDGLWRRSETTTIAGRNVQVFADEDLLFYLALHSTKERWLRLRMICDIAELLRARPSLDWNRALSAATAQGGGRMILLAAHLAAEWLGAPVPERIRAQARGDRLILRFAAERWQTMQSSNEDFSRLFELSAFRLLVLDRLADRLRYVFRTLTTPRLVHTQIVRLPAGLAAAYVPIKIVHDYLMQPTWRLARRLWGRPVNAIARPQNGPP
jgi:hypothetical protein